MKGYCKGTTKALCAVHIYTMLTCNPLFSQYNTQVQDFGKGISGALRMFCLAYNYLERIVPTATFLPHKRFLCCPIKNDLSLCSQTLRVCPTSPNLYYLINISSTVTQCMSLYFFTAGIVIRKLRTCYSI